MSVANGKEGVFVKRIWFDGKIPVPGGYALADKEEEKKPREKVKPGEYIVAHLVTPSSEPRIAFYTIRPHKTKGGYKDEPGFMVAQAKLLRFKA